MSFTLSSLARGFVSETSSLSSSLPRRVVNDWDYSMQHGIECIEANGGLVLPSNYDGRNPPYISLDTGLVHNAPALGIEVSENVKCK